MRKNDIVVEKLRKDFNDHLPIEDKRFKELKDILIAQNIESKELRKELKELREEIKPVVDAYSTANKVGTFVEWLSKKILAIGIIGGAIATAIHFK